MSNFGADTLSNSTGTGSPNIVGGELCRARTNLNGTGTIAPRDDFNVSSYVDNGVGDYTMNFATAFPNANYAALGGAASPGVAPGYTVIPAVSAPSQATASIRYAVVDAATNNADRTHIQIAFFGDRP